MGDRGRPSPGNYNIVPSTTGLFDLLAVATIVGLLFCLRATIPRAFLAGSRWFDAIAREPTWAPILIAGLAFVGASLLTIIFGIPNPAVHDEFSYLLAGDTFAHGRLTNPPHVLGVSFETMHVNVWPTYHSIYPPAQGMLLALGQVLTGRPIVGVWFSMAAACGALCWMLQAWLPPRWAVYGAILATIKLVFAPMPAPSLFQPGYWSHSYWGGAAAMLGGALVLGAVKRLASKPAASTSAVFGMGCAILANSRPFEGLVTVLFAFGYLAVQLMLAPAGTLRRFAVRCLPPVFGILVPTLTFMLYYDLVTTGDAFQRPYDLSARDYAVTPASLLQPLRPQPQYRHEMVRRYHLEVAKPQFLKQKTLTGYVSEKGEKAVRVWKVLCGPILTMPLFGAPITIRTRATRFAITGTVTVVAALSPMSWLQPHYLGPIAPLFFILVVQGLRAGSACCRRRRLMTTFAAPAILVGLCVSTAVMLVDSSVANRKDDWTLQRADVIHRLHHIGGRHLLLVAYESRYSPHREWVYNGADIDASPIVWARESTPQETQRLVEYFADRRVWRLWISYNGYTLSPLEMETKARDESSADD